MCEFLGSCVRPSRDLLGQCLSSRGLRLRSEESLYVKIMEKWVKNIAGMAGENVQGRIDERLDEQVKGQESPRVQLFNLRHHAENLIDTWAPFFVPL